MTTFYPYKKPQEEEVEEDVSLQEKVSFQPVAKAQDIGIGQDLLRSAMFAPVEFAKGVQSTLELPTALLPKSKKQTTPGQEAIAKAELESPEHLLPFLQDDDIIGPVRQPASQTALPPPQGKIEDRVRRFSKLYGDTLGTSPGLAAAGTAGAEVSQALGFSPEIGELGGFLLPTVHSFTKLLKEAPKQLKSGLTKLSGVGKKIKDFPKKPVRGQDLANAQEIITQDANKIIQNIISENVPISKLAKSNPQLETQIEGLFGKLEKVAGSKKEYLQGSFKREILDSINEARTNLIKEAPLPSESGKQALSILKQFSKVFRNKSSNIPQTIKQYRNINKNISDIMNGPRPFTSIQKGKLMGYGIVKDAIKKDLELNAPKQVSDLFKATNRVYSQLKDFQNLQSVLNPIFDMKGIDYKKLSSLTSKPKVNDILVRTLGKEGYKDFLQLQSDLVQTKDLLNAFKVKDMASLSDKLLDIPTVALMTVLDLPTWLKVSSIVRKIPKVGKDSYKLARSKALLKPETRKLSLRLKDALKQGNHAQATLVGRQLEKSIED